jgi:hypothetical protein
MPKTNPITKLVAQWRQQKINATTLARGLVGYDKWSVLISEEAVGDALANNINPPMKLITGDDGLVNLVLFSSGSTIDSYRKANKATGPIHYVTCHGTGLFRMSFDGIDQIAIDPATPNDIYYKKHQFEWLREIADAVHVEEALAGLRYGKPPKDAMQTVLDYPRYFLPVCKDPDNPSMITAPDNQGRKLAAAFTSEDAYEAFTPRAQEVADGAEVEQLQVNGKMLFEALQRMPIDGFVFNCAGPVDPVAFQQAAAGLILQG